MKYLSVRDLRTRSAKIWQDLSNEKEMIVTSNGKPIALLAPINEENLEEVVSAFRYARASAAVSALQYESIRKGSDKISMDEIDAEIRTVRAERKK
ncbi:MAG: type II toxin-antitoxin system Phd/YefM family antitoxin [Deltaproteobacteria bacterium]|nr:type II toxin-antitoxin system Phd/YefM family antitoxin [Deltaproteobacteria bacterium]